MKNEKENPLTLANVERGNNIPIVISRFGFREIEIDGKVYLLAMTKEELIEFVKKSRELSAEDAQTFMDRLERGQPTCYTYASGSCNTDDGCQWCRITGSPTTGGYFCACVTQP